MTGPAAGIDLGAVVGRVRAQHPAQFAPDLPHEVGRLPVGRDLLPKLDRLALGRLVLGGGVLAAGQRLRGLHQVEDLCCDG